jgi:hypothetical protein
MHLQDDNADSDDTPFVSRFVTSERRSKFYWHILR